MMYKTDNIYFGQYVPTEALLKVAGRKFNYEEAKALYKSVQGDKFPGWQGIAKKSVKISDDIVAKNKNIRDIAQKLQNNSSPEKCNDMIADFINQNGQNIDVII